MFSFYTSFGQNVCEFWGEVSMETISRASTLACLRSSNPAVCEFALFISSCSELTSCNDVFKVINERGCILSIEISKGVLKLKGKAEGIAKENLFRIYQELNDGILKLYWSSTAPNSR